MVLTRIEEGAAALKDESRSGQKVRDVARRIGLHRTKVFIAQAVTKVELPGDLPRVLDVRVESVDVDKALRVTDSNCGAAGKAVGNGMEVVASGNIAGEEVAKGFSEGKLTAVD